MTTLRTSSNATALMRSVLPKSVTPLDIAGNANCNVMSVMRPNLVVGTTAVTEIANLADPDAAFVQAEATDQGSLATSAAFGRQTLELADTRDQFYDSTGTFDWTSAFSMLAVFRPGRVDALQNVLGNETATTEFRVGIHVNSNGTLRGRVGNAGPSVGSISANTWYAAILSYDGTSTMTIERVGGTTATVSVSTEPTGFTGLKIGLGASFGFDGQVDMAAVFNTDLHGASNAALMADVKTMLAQYYGSTVVGVS